jgi:microcystin-dependent protein
MSRNVTIGGTWAEGAPNVPTSGEPTTGVTYRNSNLTSPTIQAALPYKTVADSSTINEVLGRLTQLMGLIESSGVLGWCPLTIYPVGGFATGSNGILYISKTAANTGNDPVADVSLTNWESYASQFLGASAQAVDSAKLAGNLPGNLVGEIPINNELLCVGLNAEQLGGHTADYFQPVPVGMVGFTAGQTAPTGWLPRDGSQVNRLTYAALFAVIGTVYGVGDGLTTFNLPDARGEFDRGWDTGGATDPGRAFGSKQLDAIQNIVGTFHGDDISVATPATGVFSSTYAGNGDTNDGSSGSTVTFDASTVVRTSTETRPVNTAYLAIIKY